MNNLIYNNILFSNKTALKLYKSIEHINPKLNNSKVVEEEDILSIIKQLCNSGEYKYPEENTFFYDDKYRVILYEHKDKNTYISERSSKEHLYTLMGWNDDYCYLRDDANGTFIYV